MEIVLKFLNQDEVSFSAKLKDENTISSFSLNVIGCPDILTVAEKFKKELLRVKGVVKEIPLVVGNTHAEMLFRELVLRIQGAWEPPYVEEELCHCRRVTTEEIDSAVISGIEEVGLISEVTSAGTGCGTCVPDIKQIVNYRRL